MDQTPLPFRFLQSHTHAPKRSTIIFIKTEHTSWTKWQATLRRTVCADGIMHCLPILIFDKKYSRETKDIPGELG